MNADVPVTLVRMSDNTVIAENDNWVFQQPVGMMEDPHEASIVMHLGPGAYTAIVSGADGGSGVALVAVYELSTPESPFINISTRGQVLAGESVMIAGFAISGFEPKTVVVRGLGPSLATSVRGVLANPVLHLVRQADNAIIGTNDDWQGAANAAELQASRFAPGNAAEAAILVTLAPGLYTAILSGQGGGTGIGLVEVYAVSD